MQHRLRNAAVGWLFCDVESRLHGGAVLVVDQSGAPEPWTFSINGDIRKYEQLTNSFKWNFTGIGCGAPHVLCKPQGHLYLYRGDVKDHDFNKDENESAGTSLDKLMV